MSTNIASQLRLAADIYETGHPFETAPRQGGLWCLPMKHERDVMRWPLDKWEIRLVLATPPDSRPLHNPENLTAEQVGAGWRLTLKGEMVPKSGKTQWWTGMEWVKSDGGYVPTGNTCRLSLSTPWPEAEKPDPLAEIRAAHEAGTPVQYCNANSSGAWSQWHDYDGGKDMSAPMPIDPHGGYREWRVKPEAPPFQLPPPPPGMQWHRAKDWMEGDLTPGEHGARTKERPNTAMKTLQELEALPDDELSKILAICLGWKHVYIERGSCGGAVFEWVWFHPWFPPEEQTADWIAENGKVNPPVFHKCLNACHEVAISLPMAKLNGRDRTSYWSTLRRGVLRNPYGNEVIDATARERTIALIYTLQKP